MKVNVKMFETCGNMIVVNTASGYLPEKDAAIGSFLVRELLLPRVVITQNLALRA